MVAGNAAAKCQCQSISAVIRLGLALQAVTGEFLDFLCEFVGAKIATIQEMIAVHPDAFGAASVR